MDPSKSQSRISQLDGVRAMAFSAVFCHHAFHVPLLWMGVDLFFVLSGFLITRNLLVLRERASFNSSIRVFLYRRVLRIIPPYYLALTAVVLLHPAISGAAPWFYGFASNVRDSLFGPIQGPLNTFWSIAVEEQFYLLWPWFVLLVPERMLGRCFVAAIVAAPLFRLAFTSVGFDAVYRLMPCRMDLLSAGALIALVDRNDATWLRRCRPRFLAAALLAIALFCGLSVAIRGFRTSLNLPLFNVVGFELSAIFFVAFLAYVLASERGPLVATLRHPVLRYVGTVSYMAYLTHVLALDIVRGFRLDGFSTGVLGYVLTIAFATTSWYLVEKPLQRLRGLVVPSQGHMSLKS